MNTNRFAAIRNRLNARVNAALNAAEQRIDSAVTIAETEIEQATAAMEDRVTTATIAAVEQITAMGNEIATGINGDGTFPGDDATVEAQVAQAGDRLALPNAQPDAVMIDAPAANEANNVRALLNAGVAA
ncbi:hypothetical protein [Burkholderia cenocepacia]|uniref:hypothetical protein n=1 Tax=Burkholderia cenocepacia TaxID=95486 RepID=UPI002856252F|nr:hypothetical protein [Burkholderia cenocepacia]MDR8054234.1 hypothetical protein [Burkholderia cenocepacia]MDR8064677.1 hypothetical protein [Burkholderia cenocepacia]